MILKEITLKWKLKNWQKKNKVLRTNIIFKDSLAIGILFSQELNTNIEIIEKFKNKLLNEGKSVKILTCITNSKIISNSENVVFSLKDISVTGKIENDKLIDFLKTEFDFLFCLAPIYNPLINFVLQKSVARCRVGIYNGSNFENYEFMIKVPQEQDLEISLNQMLYYVKVMKN